MQPEAPLAGATLVAPGGVDPAIAVAAVVDRSRAARSTMWSALENGGLTVISFSSLIIYARFLSAADFGLFSIVLALVELLDVLVSMLFHDVLVQKRDLTPRHFDTAFTSTLVLSLALFGMCWGLSRPFASLVHNPAAAAVLAWTALRFPCTALGATIVAQQRRELSFRMLAIRSLLGRVSGAALGIALVAMGAGIWGLVAQQILIAFIGSVVLWVGAVRRPRLYFSSQALRQMIGFGASAVASLLLAFAVRRVFTIISGIRLGSEMAGYLNIGFRAVDVLWAIAVGAVGQVALPVLSRLQGDPVRIKAAYRSALELTCFVLYPCFWGIALVAPEVVDLLFGARWLASTPYVMALALLMTVQAPRLLATPTLTAIGRPRAPMIGLSIEIALMLALLALLGHPTLSLTAAVGIWIVRELVSLPVMAWVVARATGIGVVDQFARAGGPLLASVAMGLALVGLRRVLPDGWGALARLALLAPAGAAVFLVTGWSIDPAPLRRLLAFVASVAPAPVAVATPAPPPGAAVDRK
jgi:O-antigen/teichoic acid export membrane protein